MVCLRASDDCENLTGSLNYMILIDWHVYSLVCGVGIKKIKALVKSGRVKKKHHNFFLLFFSIGWQRKVFFFLKDSIDSYFVVNDTDSKNLFRNKPVKVVNNFF